MKRGPSAARTANADITRAAGQVVAGCGPTLKRNCACGQHTSGDECRECKKKEERSSGTETEDREGEVAPGGTVLSLGNDFSQVRARGDGGRNDAAQAESEIEADRAAHAVIDSPHHDPEGVDAPVEAAATDELVRPLSPADQGLSASDREQAVAVARAEGRPLSLGEKTFMESRFGFDFSRVRIHTDARADVAARALEARAFTVGSDVVLRPNAYREGTPSGRFLLAHELAHVVQQTHGRGPGAQSDVISRKAEKKLATTFRFTVTPKEVMDAKGFRVLVCTKVLGMEAARAAEYAEKFRWSGPQSTNGVARADVGKAVVVSIDADVYRLAKKSAPAESSGAATNESSPSLMPPADKHDDLPKAEKPAPRPKGGHPSQESARHKADNTLRGPAAPDADASNLEGEAGHQPKEPGDGAVTESKTEGGTADSTVPAIENAIHEVTQVAEKAAEPQKRQTEDLRKAIESAAKKVEAEKRAHQGKARGVSLNATVETTGAVAEGPSAGDAPAAKTDDRAEPGRKGPADAKGEQGDQKTGVVGSAPTAVEDPELPEVNAQTETDALEAEMAAAASEAVPSQTTPPGTDTGGGTSTRVPDQVPADLAKVASKMSSGAVSPDMLSAGASPIAADAVAPAKLPDELSKPSGDAPSAAAPSPETAETEAPATTTAEPTPEPEPAAEAPVAAAPEAVAAAEGAPATPEGPVASAATEPSTAAGPSPASTEAEPADAAETPQHQEAATGELLPAEHQVAVTSLGEDAIPGTDPGEGGGGGGGGGGGPAEAAEAVEEAPDVSQMKPAAAIGAIAVLPPVALGKALTGVGSAIANDVGTRREYLQNSPPTVERPTGAPISKEKLVALVPPAPALPTKPDVTKVDAVAPGPEKKTPAPKPTPDGPPAPIAKLKVPDVRNDDSGKVSAEDAAKVKTAIASMPVTDPGLNLTAGTAPTLALQGNADPTQLLQQHDKLRDSLVDARTKGAQEVAAPMGEEALFPQAPAETLRGKVAAGGGGGAAAKAGGGAKAVAGGGGGGTDDAISIIAQQKKGPEIAAAVGKAQGDVAEAESAHQTKVAETETKQTAAISEAEQLNAKEQTKAREDAQGKATTERGAWAKGQDDTLRKADTDASKQVADASKQVGDTTTQANKDAAGKIDEGNEKAEKARKDGEAQAEQERSKGQQESGGFFELAASAVKGLVDKVKSGIQRVLAAARTLVKDVLDAAKKAAVDVIEKSRKWVVDRIQAVGDLLIKVGGVALAAFPGLRDRFTKAIKGIVALAEKVVNALADVLRKGVTLLLDAWAAQLDFVLGLLAKGLEMALESLSAVVQGAIAFAKAVAQAYGDLMQVIKDVASDPGGWVRKLGAAMLDGVKKFPKAAIKAVKEWFNAKVEGVVGIAKMLWNVVTGKMSLAEIGKMAFEVVKAALPAILIRLIIEKLVSLLVPAAAAVMAIVEGLMAAWGTVGQLLKNFQMFVAFLKAVKTGSGGQQFAELLSGVVVLVLDFIANYLLLRLGKALQKFAAKLVAIAKRLMKKVAKLVKKGLAKLKKKFGGGKKGAKGKKPKKKDKDKSKEERRRRDLERAKAELPPKIEPMLKKGSPKLLIRARLLLWRLQYRLRKLALQGSRIVVANSPETMLVDGHLLSQSDVRALLTMVREISVALEEKIAAKSPTLPGAGAIPPNGSPVPAWRRHFLGRQMPARGTSRSIELQPGFVANESSPWFRRQSQVGTVHVHPAGAFDPDVVNLFKRDPKGTADALQALATGRKPILTGALGGHESTIAGTALLMFGLEPARNISSLATSAMVTELAREGMPPHGAVGLFPMAPRGAMAANRPVEEFRGGGRHLEKIREGKKPRQMIENEVRLVAKFIETVMKEDLFKDSKAVVDRLAELRPKVEKRLEEFFLGGAV